MGLADRYLTEEYKNVLNIRYTQLDFTLYALKGGKIPKNKNSAIRGGIGDALLKRLCISDRNCDTCSFFDECIIQHTMYSKMDEETRPEFMTDKDSLGYIIDCENFSESICGGDSLQFTLTLFGKTIVHAGVFIQAVAELGRVGLGKNRIKFLIKTVTSDGNAIFLNRGLNSGDAADSCTDSLYETDMSMLTIETVADYVGKRLFQIESEGCSGRIITKSPLTLKHNGSIMDHFDMEVIIKAVQRRIYMLDCFEGIDGLDFYEFDLPIPTVFREEHKMTGVSRYSSRQNGKVTFKGIEGFIQLEKAEGETFIVLLAGELLHVGKQVSFGFGRYIVR